MRGRFGIDLKRYEYEELCGMIHRNEGEYIAKYSNSRTIWKLLYGGKTIYAIYDKSRNQIASFLTPRMVERSWGYREETKS